ncbi:MAG: hypothetical protein DCF30_21000 [Hyphomicrobiales bacterium]|nr:MAG: hypothetical protein DCF30_21000 [Hyphomicrobiales bacterium]
MLQRGIQLSARRQGTSEREVRPDMEQVPFLAMGALAAPRLSKSVHAANHAPRFRRDPSVEPRCRVDAVNRQTEADDEKRARLAAALRENLKRRKAQARARRAEEAPAQDEASQAQADPTRS